MGRVFTSLQRLKDGCLEVLSSHFARRTKPLSPPLPLSNFMDIGRSKSELIDVRISAFPCCSAHLDRDLNASINILALGL